MTKQLMLNLKGTSKIYLYLGLKQMPTHSGIGNMILRQKNGVQEISRLSTPRSLTSY